MTTPYYEDAHATIHHGDCLDVLATLPDRSVDAVVTDPPYGLEFMGKAWDSFKAVPSGGAGNVRRAQAAAFGEWCEAWAAECLRVLKPGGHLLAFGGSRTWHRLACAVEDAGFEVRDSIAWLYGSGFPKSLDVSKAIDKAAGAARDLVPLVGGALNSGTANGWGSDPHSHTAPLAGTRWVDSPATPDAERWQGWGTALKPAFEPVVVARKPLAGTVAGNVLEHGTGALNIDACRVGDGEGVVTFDRAPRNEDGSVYDLGTVTGVKPSGPGRLPANVVLDDHTAALLDEQSGELHSQDPRTRKSRSTVVGATGFGTGESVEYADKGGASRFFYVAKADQSERPRVNGTAHPTVKPLNLMRWLVRLVTPPGGTVLEPFAGSGTTVEACLLEGFRCIAIEREADYLPLIQQRINRRRDPLTYLRTAGDDLGLFDEEPA